MNLAPCRSMAGPGVAGLRRVRSLILILSIASVLPLAACGKRAPPQPPPDQPKVYPRTYPYDPTAKPYDSDEGSK